MVIDAWREKLSVLGGSKMSLGLKKCCINGWQEILLCTAAPLSCKGTVYHIQLPDDMSTFKCMSFRNSKLLSSTLSELLLAFLTVGGAIASEPLQRKLAAHLCQLEPERRSLASLPRGKAEGRGSCTGSWTSHQTWRSPRTGAGAGECTKEWARDWMNDWCLNRLEAGIRWVGYSKRNYIWCVTADYSIASK